MLRRSQADERGLATTELAILFPVLILVVLGIAQVAMWSHANSVAQAAADFGAERAAAFGADPGEGVAAVQSFLSSAGTVQDGIASVTIDGPDRLTVVVTGSYPGVFGSLDVRASSTVVRERVPG